MRDRRAVPRRLHDRPLQPPWIPLTDASGERRIDAFDPRDGLFDVAGALDQPIEDRPLVQSHVPDDPFVRRASRRARLGVDRRREARPPRQPIEDLVLSLRQSLGLERRRRDVMTAREPIARRAARAVRHLLHPGEAIPHQEVRDRSARRIVPRKEPRDLGVRRLDHVLDLHVRRHLPALEDLLAHEEELRVRPPHELAERALVPPAKEPLVEVVARRADVPRDRAEPLRRSAGRRPGHPRHDRTAALTRKTIRPCSPPVVVAVRTTEGTISHVEIFDKHKRRTPRMRANLSGANGRDGFAAPRNYVRRGRSSSAARGGRSCPRASGARRARRAVADRVRPRPAGRHTARTWRC